MVVNMLTTNLQHNALGIHMQPVLPHTTKNGINEKNNHT